MRRRIIPAIVLLVACVSAIEAADVQRLSLKDAEQRALDNHPRIRGGQDLALASGEVARETKSAFFPTVFGNVTGAGAPNGTRIAAGGLNNPTILDRFAAGFSVSQLLTDFGRTSNLVKGQLLRADAEQQDVVNDRATVLLEVDRAYFDALRAQAVLKVAQQTVQARQLVADQIQTLAASGLKSGLDVSFANVNLAQAQLLLIQAQNDVSASFAGLTAALGSSQEAEYELADEPMPPAPDDSSAALIAAALKDRPDVIAQRLSDQAAARIVQAERALSFPSISAIGAAGVTPYHQTGLNDRYSALGVNISVPVTNGSLYSSRRAEAAFRAQAEQEVTRDLENRVTRDVTVAWLNARTAYQRMALTDIAGRNKSPLTR